MDLLKIYFAKINLVVYLAYFFEKVFGCYFCLKYFRLDVYIDWNCIKLYVVIIEVKYSIDKIYHVFLELVQKESFLF